MKSEEMLLEESKDDLPKGFSKRNIHLDSQDINTFDLLRSIDSARLSKNDHTIPKSSEFITIAEHYVAPIDSKFKHIKDVNPLDSNILEQENSTPSKPNSPCDNMKLGRYMDDELLQEEPIQNNRVNGCVQPDELDTCIVDSSLTGPFLEQKPMNNHILRDVTNACSPIGSPHSNKNVGSPVRYNQDSMAEFTHNLTNKLSNTSKRNEHIMNSEMKNPLEESDVDDIKDSHPGSPVIYKTSKTLQTTLSNGGRHSYNILDDF